jgi:hypothetical protein
MRSAPLAFLFTCLLVVPLLGSCDPEAGPLPDAISCVQDEDCEDDSSFCNGTPVCVERMAMTEHGIWRISTCEQRTSPRCPGLCDEEADRCRCPDPDADGDGHAAIACGGDDCDDEDDARFPGNAEICDRDDVDEDCDLTTFGHRDADGDGWPDARCCNRGDRRDECGNDCDDELAGMHPTAVEACDSVDNDCDGAADEGVLVSAYQDADGDGFGTGDQEQICAGLAGYASVGEDCDDTLSQVHPGSFRCVDGPDIEFCGASATWLPASCPGLGPCVVQPDGTGVCLPGEGRACEDGADNDGDTLADFPDDPGCSAFDDDTEETPAAPPACSNGMDDDGDGTADYVFGTGDPGCVSASDTSERESTAASCDNGRDDDADDDIDFPDDASCASPAADTERAPRCSNGVDDDMDGAADFGMDLGCDTAQDDSERGEPGSNYLCDNGLDDDMDGAADYPGDLGCTGPTGSEI